MSLQVALAVQQEVESRITETDTLRRKHVERAQYEAELARRRYMNVDPANRLVADSLEAEWNNKLRILAEAQTQYEQQTQKQRLLIDSQTREQLLALATDFPRIWDDPSVEPRERKRILTIASALDPGEASTPSTSGPMAKADGELQNWPKATWSNNVTEGSGGPVFKEDLEFAMDR